MKLKKWMIVLIIAVIGLVGFYQGVKPLYQDITNIWQTIAPAEQAE